jgi:hypothetical protein
VYEKFDFHFQLYSYLNGVYKIKYGTLSQYYHDNKVRELGHKNTLNLEGTHGHIITN